MSGVWPSGPDGVPLPADAAGGPVWPSEQYRRDYEQAVAQRAARDDATKRQANPLLIVAILVFFAVLVALTVTNR